MRGLLLEQYKHLAQVFIDEECRRSKSTIWNIFSFLLKGTTVGGHLLSEKAKSNLS